MTEIPPDWSSWGALPDALPPVGEESEWDSMTEDLWQAASPDRRYTIDVGWYPEASPDGAFTCHLVVDADWERPRLRHRTPDLHEVQAFIRDAVAATRSDGVRGVATRTPPSRRYSDTSEGIRAAA